MADRDDTYAHHGASHNVPAPAVPYLASAPSPFRGLERLLPATLWSPSFLKERSLYTLTPLQPHRTPYMSRETPSSPLYAHAFTRPELSSISTEPCGSSEGSSSSLWAVPASPPRKRLSTSRRSSSPATTAPMHVSPQKSVGTAAARHSSLASSSSSAASHAAAMGSADTACQPSLPSWSLMDMHRAFLHTHYPEGIGFAPSSTNPAGSSALMTGASLSRSEAVESTLCKDEAERGNAIPLPNKGNDSKASGCCKDEDSLTRIERSGRDASRDPFPPTAKRAQTAVLCNSTDSDNSHAATTDAPSGTAIRDLDALAGALEVAESLLHQVERQHRHDCPLCSPKHAPTWFSGGGGHDKHTRRKRNREAAPRSIDDASPVSVPSPKRTDMSHSWVSSSSSSVTFGGSPVSEENTAEAIKARRALILARAQAFLDFHKERVAELNATRPTMYCCTAEHDLVTRCRELGGITLLEAILLGL